MNTARLEAIELNRSTPDEDSFSDFVDRQARSKNVILFNVPDAPDDSNNSDSSTVDLIFTKLALDIKPITIQRLGKFDGKIRPLKISLASVSDVFKTLGSSRKLKSDQIFNTVRITSDKTPKQRLYFQNLRKELDKRRSDVSKLNTLTPLLCTSGLDIIAFTETWLYPSISTSELNFSNYTVFRCDRSSLNSSTGRGGGVLIAVKSTLICKVLNVSVKSVEHFDIPSGVPQGDHLSTLLFNIFINDLPNVITNSNILLFADDAKLVKIIKSEQDALNLQLDINNLILWCNENNLFLNIQKCKCMKFYLTNNPVNSQYSISGTNVEHVNQFKDLGIIFDRKLNFSLHTEMIKNKAFRNLGFIKRTCAAFSDPIPLTILYFSLIRSNLEYCPLIWINSTSKQALTLESVQNFVNSAVSVLHHAKLLIFADDMKIFFRIKSISDCHLLQNDLQRLVAWGESLVLALNIAKCSVMTFSRINAAIEHTYTVNNTALTTCSIDCPEILSLIRFKINYPNTRDPKPFFPLFSTKNYILNSPANLLMTAGNTFVFDYS
ncbi:hypothetical protein QTP88_027102 [Uroleucon formosanum]